MAASSCASEMRQRRGFCPMDVAPADGQGGKEMEGRDMAGQPKRAAALGWPFYVAFALAALSASALMSLQEGLNMVPSGPGMNPHIESVTTPDPWGNPCDTMMNTMKGMSVMGESMTAMTNHMCITSL